MNLLNNIKNFVSGNDDEKKLDQDNIDDIQVKFKKLKFKRTHLARCFVSPAGGDFDEPSLSIDKTGDESISKHFHDIISLVGPPGVGKSTLSSTMYNVMRGTKDEYFKVSHNSMFTFTRGIWSLTEDIKVRYADKDKIDILDLEGIDDEDVIHYLVVVSMALSKAILLCASYRGNPRFQFSMLKTLASGFKLFTKYGIRVPKPIIYIQVPFGQNKFQVSSDADAPLVDCNGLFDFAKRKYRVLKGFEFRTFDLPTFDNNNGGRLNGAYGESVAKLINELKAIPEGTPAFSRMQYARIVASALNSNSPKIVSDMNLNFFKNTLNNKLNYIKNKSLSLMQHKFELQNLQKAVSFEEYIALVCPNGVWSYLEEVLLAAKSLPYFDENDARHVKMIDDLKNEKLFIDPKVHCKPHYELAMDNLRKKFKVKGDKLMELDNEEYKQFMEMKMKEEKNKIEYKGSTNLPHQLKYEIDQKKRQLQRQWLEKTQNMAQIPGDYLDHNINQRWDIIMSGLKQDWATKLANAKSRPRKVMTSGDHVCPSCNKDHSCGVSHLTCPANASAARWLWVDAQTNYCVCDACGTERTITSVVCSSCDSALKAKIITIN